MRAPPAAPAIPMHEGIGVCRDFAHLAIALCRCMNNPARYCTGYLGDIGVPVDPNPNEFRGWAEVFLAGRWYTIDARHNHPRIRAYCHGPRCVTRRTSRYPTAFGIAKLARFEGGDPGAGSGWLIADVSIIPKRGMFQAPARANPKFKRRASSLPAGCANAKANVPVQRAASPAERALPLTNEGLLRSAAGGPRLPPSRPRFFGHALVISHPLAIC